MVRRDEGGHGVLYPSEAGHAVQFASVGLCVGWKRLYEDALVGIEVPGPMMYPVFRPFVLACSNISTNFKHARCQHDHHHLIQP